MSENVIKIVPSELDGNSRYTIRIRSVNSFGVPSDWSEAVVVDTDEASTETGGRITLTANGMIAYDDNGQTSFVYSGLGAGIRTNYVINPSFEINTTGWTALSNTSMTRITSDFFVGEPAYKACLQVQASANASGVGIITAIAERISVTPGTSFTVSAYIKAITSSVSLKVGVRFYNAGGTQISEFVSPSPKVVNANGQWSRLSLIDITVPTGAAKLGFIVYSTTTMSSGQKYLIDGILVEQASTLGDYFDGSTSLGVTEWTGTAHASSSTFDMSSSYYVDGGVFTAGTLQTAVDVGVGSPYGAPGVKMSTSGIQGYSGLQATPAFSLDAAGKFRVGSDTQFMYFDGTNLTITGNLAAGTIDIGGFDNTSFHVDATGNMWVGAGSYVNAPFKVSSAGNLYTNSFNLIGATPNQYSATWGHYSGNEKTNLFIDVDYALKFSHGPYSIFDESAIYWTSSTPTWYPDFSHGGLFEAVQSQSLVIIGPKTNNASTYPPAFYLTSHAFGNSIVGIPDHLDITPDSHTIILTTGTAATAGTFYEGFLRSDVYTDSGYLSLSVLNQNVTQQVSIDLYTGAIGNSIFFTITENNENYIPFWLYPYGQSVIGPGADVTLPWTTGTRGNAGFNQSALVVSEKDDNSNTHLSLRHVNMGTADTNGLDLIIVRSTGVAIIAQRENASLSFRTNNTARAEFDSSGHFKPAADNTYTCGASGARWSEVWAATGTIQTSDLRTKTDIKPTDLGLQFIEKLNPVSFKFIIGGNEVIQDNELGREIKSKPGTRNHYGLIAQEVKQVLDDLEIPDFSGWVLTDPNNPDSEQGLRYEQFISPLIKAVQELSHKVNNLENLLNKR